MFFGPYDWLMIPGLLLGLYAQFKLSNTYSRYLEQGAASGFSGAQTARAILDDAGLYDIPVEMTEGHLTDHYDPTHRKLCLSEANYHGRSLSALGVAAHEAGHALQHKESYVPLQIRSMLAPVTGFASVACWLILLAGFLLTTFRVISVAMYAKILPIAIGLFAVVTFFQVITLPVEYDASSRAKKQLLRLGLVREDERKGVSEVLNAAALTYVAAMVSSMLELLKLLLIQRDLDNRS